MALTKVLPLYFEGLRRAGARNFPVSVMSIKGSRVVGSQVGVKMKVPSPFYMRTVMELISKASESMLV